MSESWTLSSLAGLVFGSLFSLAAIWCLLLGGRRLVGYARTPQVLPLALMPAPITRTGVAVRLLGETLVFRSLLRASPITWCASIAFHYGLLLVLLVHLRFLFPLLPLWMVPILGLSGMATVVLIVGLCVLLARRLLVDRLRYISTPADYGYLLLLLSIAASGVVLKRFWPVDLQAVGAFVRSFGGIDWPALPAHPVLLAHLAGVLLLLLVFPLGKLMHGPGLWFSPTFTERDPARRQGPRAGVRHGVRPTPRR